MSCAYYLLQGTTFSGVAFAFATNTEAKEDIITEWPGAGNQTKQKVGVLWWLGLSRTADRARYPPFYTMINTKKSSAGVQTSLMRSRQPATPKLAFRK